MFCGSSDCFIIPIKSTVSPSSCRRYDFLPCPIPCSPVQVPPISIERWLKRSANCLAFSISSGDCMSTNTAVWKLPSPTCPTIGASKLQLSISLSVSSTQSARREIGTHASVTMASQPGRRALAAQYASWRACHKWVRSSVFEVHLKSDPPNSE